MKIYSVRLFVSFDFSIFAGKRKYICLKATGNHIITFYDRKRASFPAASKLVSMPTSSHLPLKKKSVIPLTTKHTENQWASFLVILQIQQPPRKCAHTHTHTHTYTREVWKFWTTWNTICSSSYANKLWKKIYHSGYIIVKQEWPRTWRADWECK